MIEPPLIWSSTALSLRFERSQRETMSELINVNHQRVKTNGIWIHVAEQGTGPLVLLLHGFPETWYSWRHQIRFLANNGYHVVAPDLRGYGDSDSPLNPNSYSVIHLVGDLIGLLDHFGVQQVWFICIHIDLYINITIYACISVLIILLTEKVFVVGHDWGAIAGWYLSLFRPDRVKALVNLSAPYFHRSQTSGGVDYFRELFGDGCYVFQFQVYASICIYLFEIQIIYPTLIFHFTLH